VGTELTEGIIQDSHARFLSSELTSMGFTVIRGVQLPDRFEEFLAELGRAAAECELIVITGGLGPTADDLTREVLSEAAKAPLEYHEEIWDTIVRRFRGRKVSETNKKQAMAPRGFHLIPNPNGTAPGLSGDVGKALVVAFPGPPSELRPMFVSSVTALLSVRFGTPPAGEIFWATAMMVPESELEEGLTKVRRSGVTWGTRVDEDRIAFSLRGGTPDERTGVFTELGKYFGGERIRKGDVKPTELLSSALARSGKLLVTAESCTGGLLGKWMTDLPGSSKVYWGGFVVYADEAKIRLLGVERRLLDEQGAVSAEAVSAMAAGALEKSGADIGIAVSGIAGPDGGTPEKPVGTVWGAVAERGGKLSARKFFYPGYRDLIRRRTAVNCFLWAEAELLGRDFPEF
jgi:nicotinamide-nucleotide amidase